MKSVGERLAYTRNTILSMNQKDFSINIIYQWQSLLLADLVNYARMVVGKTDAIILIWPDHLLNQLASM